MDLSNPLTLVGLVGVGLVVVCWLGLVVRGADSARVAWLGALGLYTALGSLFVNLLRSAESTFMTGVFGFLCSMFVAGWVLSIWKLAGAFSGSRGGGDNASH